MDNKKVVNLTEHKLSKKELSVLSKGLTFCPTPHHPDPGEIRDDMDNLHRRCDSLL
jgi:hypothetical protein